MLLLVARILAYNHHAPFALDNLALFTDGFDRGTDFHTLFLQFIGSYAAVLGRRKLVQLLERQVMRPRVRS